MAGLNKSPNISSLMPQRFFSQSFQASRHMRGALLWEDKIRPRPQEMLTPAEVTDGQTRRGSFKLILADSSIPLSQRMWPGQWEGLPHMPKSHSYCKDAWGSSTH